MCEFGPLKDRSSAVLCLCLTQDVHDPTDQDNSSALIVSRIYFVDTPGAERLALDPTSLRIKEGPTLNKSLLGLGSLVKALANPNDSPFAEYGHCVLTTLLQVMSQPSFCFASAATITPHPQHPSGASRRRVLDHGYFNR